MTTCAFMVPSWPPERAFNGVVTYVRNLAGPLGAEGLRVRLIAAQVLPEDFERSRRDGVIAVGEDRGSLIQRLKTRVAHAIDPQDAVEAQHGWRLGRALRRIDREQGLSLYEMEEAFGMGRRLRRGVPGLQVIRLHGPWFLCVPPLGLSLDDPKEKTRIEHEGDSIAKADAVSSPSDFALEAVRRRYGLPLRGAVVIPNPTPEPEPSGLWSRARAVPRSVLFVGRFDRLKGGDTVVKAFARVHAGEPNATLHFAGPDQGLMRDDSGQKVSFREFLERHLEPTARGRITFHGPLPPERIAELRARSEITIVASRFETFSMTTVEALAAGSPLLAAGVAAIPEVLRWAGDQLLFEPGNAEELAAAILRRFAEPELTDRLAAEGRVECRNRFSPAVVARATRGFYEDLLRERSHRRSFVVS